MADTKTSALPAVTTVSSTIEIPVNDGATSKKMTVDQLENYVITANRGLVIAMATANYTL